MPEVADRPARTQIQRTDWFAVITELQTKHGIPIDRIGRRMGLEQMTPSMLRHYRMGTEPVHWRGDLLLTFWCEVTGKAMASRPMVDVIHRANVRGRIRPSHPSMQAPAPTPPTESLPAWPTAPLADILKRKPGRPKKEQTA